MRNNVGWMEGDENTFCAQVTKIEEKCHPQSGYLHKFALMCLWSEGQGLDERQYGRPAEHTLVQQSP